MKALFATKVHFGHALFIIASCSTVPVMLFVGLILFDASLTSAQGLMPIGVQVLTPPIPCIMEPITGICPACIACGNGEMQHKCAGLFEVDVLPVKPIFASSLRKGIGLCLSSPVPPLGGIFKPGARCMGRVFMPPVGPHILSKFRCP